jgi:hypothetical protein
MSRIIDLRLAPREARRPRLLAVRRDFLAGAAVKHTKNSPDPKLSPRAYKGTHGTLLSRLPPVSFYRKEAPPGVFLPERPGGAGHTRTGVQSP